MPTPIVSPTLEWNVLVRNRQGLVRDLPPGLAVGIGARGQAVMP